jgi:signal transduction histidine kinase
MDLHRTTVESVSPSAPALRGRRLILVWVAWSGLVALALALGVVALLARYRQLSAPPADVRADLVALGLAPTVYAGYFVALSVIFGVGCAVVAALIVWRKPDDGMALFVALFFVLIGSLAGPNAAALEELHPALVLPARFGQFLVIGSQLLFLFIFPNGRFVPRWTRIPALLWMVGLLIALRPAGVPLAAGPGVGGALLLISGFGGGMGAQIYRYRRVSGSVQRQQTKWVVFGAAAAAVAFMVLVLPRPLLPALIPFRPLALLTVMITEGLATCATLLIPLTIGIAILRYRLWDIDIIINRTLVYGALTTSVIGLYVLVVGGVGVLFQAQGNLLIALLATGLIAVLFHPLRDRLQRAVNRLIYGERDDPYAVVTRLGQRLEATLAPDAVLPTIVETVAQALKLPYLAIALYHGDTLVVTAEYPNQVTGSVTNHLAPASTPAVVTLPLTYQGEPVGQLLVTPRAAGEAFSAADRRLLAALARQAGMAVQTVRLTRDLQRSRERLVTAREEERRRLRRELHDGLGPALAGFTLKVAAIRNLLPHGQPVADAWLAELGAEIEAAVGDIRRLAYDLRPPALDELGLVGALRARAAQHSAGPETTGLQVRVEAPNELPPLPAAVEVAAYRIVQEALANIVHHAQARTCVVRLAVDDMLRLEVRDDGIGLPAAHHAGVGQLSMRERASELGGICAIEPIASGGTCVRADLPLAQE